MKKSVKITSFVLAIVMFLSAIVVAIYFSVSACKKRGGSTNENAINPPEGINLTGTLHKINVTETNRVFIKDGATEYKIVATSSDEPDDEESQRIRAAAICLVKYLSEATGATIGVVYDTQTYSANSKYIVLGDKDMFAAAGLTMPTDNLGRSGYYIKSAGESVFIMASGKDGMQMGVLAFLREVMGFDLFYDIAYFSRTGETLPDLDITERPDYDYRVQLSMLPQDTSYGMGFSSDDGRMPVKSDWDGSESPFHNTFHYLPPEIYASEYKKEYDSQTGQAKDVLDGDEKVKNPDYHPKWFADSRVQLCYTAHGDAQELAAMKDKVVEKMKETITANPNREIISFTQQDVDDRCRCAACEASVAKYGSITGAMIQFINQVDDEVQKWLKETYPERSIFIQIFAYQVSVAPPAKKNDDGRWTPIDDTVVAHPTVAIYYAPIYMAFTSNWYDSINADYEDYVKGWQACSSLMHLWLYESNFSYYLYPYCTFDCSVENYRFFRANGSDYMFNEAQYDQSSEAAFSRLKTYINSKTWVNLSLDYRALADKFFDVYFGPASAIMRRYFDEMNNYYDWLENEYSTYLNGQLYEVIEKPEYWPVRTLENWLGYTDMAMESIAPIEKSDPEKYKLYYDHILLETIFPRWALLRNHTGYFNADSLAEMRSSFAADARYLDITHLSEGARDSCMLKGIFDRWGV